MSRIPESELILNPDGSIYHLSLLPQHINEYVITVGDPGRVYRVSQHFDSIDFEMNKREFISHIGTYKGKRITVISTGMGTDNIEILMNELDALVNIDLKTRLPKKKTTSLKIIRIGTSGAIQPDLVVGTHLISQYGVGFDTLMCFYDLPQTPYEANVSEALQAYTGLPFAPYCVEGSPGLLSLIGQQPDIVIGNTITCPGFYGPQGRQLRAPISRPQMLHQLGVFKEHDFWMTNFEMETAGYYAMGRILGHEVLSANAIVANRISNTFSTNANKVIDNLIEKVLDAIASSYESK